MTVKRAFPCRIAAALAVVWAGFSALPLGASEPPLIVAHRGASGEAPENTMPAFELAWQQGADAIEGDFRLTRDRRIVCIHDADTKRVAGIRKVVKDSTLAELQSLDVGKWKGPEFKDTRIPTLVEICRSIPDGKKLFLEVKCGPEIVPLLLNQIDASPLQPGQLVVISFNDEVVRTMKARRPGWTVNLLHGFNGRNPEDLDREMIQVMGRLRTTKASGLGHSAYLGLTVNHLGRLEQAGFEHHVWTVNDTAKAGHFLKRGTRSITTDFPKAMIKWLQRQGADEVRQ